LTQNLESYFLDVVQKARQSATETSGAVSGGRVAAYLRGEADAEEAKEKILERLTLSAAGQREQPAKRQPQPSEKVDQSKLESLTQQTQEKQPAAASAPAPTGQPKTEPPKPEDLSKANEKLSSLLGKHPK